jgi:hypothetical protein
MSSKLLSSDDSCLGKTIELSKLMKPLTKLVAGIVAVALFAAPLQAVASCFSSTHCADCSMHCAHCCASMAKVAKMREATRATDTGPAMPTQPSQAPCCKVSSSEPVPPAVPQETHRWITPVLPVTAYTPAESARSSVNDHVSPNRWTKGRAQPVLCTFLI